LIRQAWTDSGTVYGYRKLTDITYVKTHEGWPYLSVAIDLFYKPKRKHTNTVGSHPLTMKSNNREWTRQASGILGAPHTTLI